MSKTVDQSIADVETSCIKVVDTLNKLGKYRQAGFVQQLLAQVENCKLQIATDEEVGAIEVK